MIPKRYKRTNGVVLAQYNSRHHGDPDTDYVTKSLIATTEVMRDARLDDPAEEWDLVIYVDTATHMDADDAEGVVDQHEVYRVPFPHNLMLRKRLLRLIIAQPRFWAN